MGHITFRKTVFRISDVGWSLFKRLDGETYFGIGNVVGTRFFDGFHSAFKADAADGLADDGHVVRVDHVVDVDLALQLAKNNRHSKGNI